MMRLVSLLLAMLVLATADVRIAGARADDEKKEEKKKDDKKEAKKDEKKDDKKEVKKDEKKDDKPKAIEVKLTDAQKQEVDKLSGSFTVVSFERDGKKSPPAELQKMKIVQKGADWSFYLGEEITQGKDIPFADKTPMEIDAIYTNGPAHGQKVLGIYKIEGDTVTYCWAEPKKERPKEFSTKEGSGQTLMVLKRTKEDKPAEKEKPKEKEKEKEKPKGKDTEKAKEKGGVDK